MYNYLSCFMVYLLTTCFAVSATATEYPLTVTDDRNKKVTFEKAPQSVAAVSTFGADLVIALGKELSGISTLNHQRSAYLGNKLDTAMDLGEIHETNLELLNQLKPDLTVGIRLYTEPFEKKFEQASKFLAFDFVDYSDSQRLVNLVGQVLNESAKATELNTQFAKSLQQHSGKAPGGISAVFLWHWADVPYGFFDHSFTIEILEALKADNAIGASPQPKLRNLDSTPISLEKLLKLDPDVIISFRGEPGKFRHHPVWQRLKAVKNGRAWRVGDQYVMPHGPIARDMVLRELAHLLYPQQFAAPTDIPEAARARPMVFKTE